MNKSMGIRLFFGCISIVLLVTVFTLPAWSIDVQNKAQGMPLQKSPEESSWPEYNRVPTIEPLFAALKGKRVRVIKKGMEVVVRAKTKDPDGDKLSYKWVLPSGAGTLNNYSMQEVVWKVGKPSGQKDLKVFVSDGNGGVASGFLTINEQSELRFSGKVLTNKEAPVDSAEVDINGKKAKTNTKGFFELLIDDTESNRLVLNIRKNGFGLVSHIYDQAISNGKWRLPVATTKTFHPREENIYLQAVTAPAECLGPPVNGINWSAYPNERIPRFFETNGRLKVGTHPAALADAISELSGGTSCKPGFSVSIPANSLVGENGEPPAGQVQVSVSNVDLYSPDGMPGDYTVNTKDGPRVMVSSGAATVNIFDNAGETYQLRKGKKATLIFPIDSIQLKFHEKSIQPTIPLLVYDEKSGNWNVEGTAKLNKSKNAYEAQVGHLSTWNTDLVKIDQSCVKIISSAISGNYNLNVIIPTDTGPVSRTFLADNATQSIHAIYNLPSNTDIGLIPYRDGQPTVPLGNYSVNTGPPQIPTDPNRPDYDYFACQSQVELFDAGGPGLPAPPTNLTLQPRTLSSITLSWDDNADNEDEYLVYQSFDGQTYNYLGSLPASTTSEPITELRPCLTSYYKVVAANSSGQSAFSNSVAVTTDTTAAIHFTNGVLSPFFSDDVTPYPVGCYDPSIYTAALGILDANGNHILDNQQGASNRLFPREAVILGPSGWVIEQGKKYEGNANLVLIAKLNTGSTYQRDQFVTLYLRVDENETVYAERLMAGDMTHPIPANGQDGIIMINDPSTEPITLKIEGGALPEPSNPGYIFGSASGWVSFQSPIGGLPYSSHIEMEFNMPLYFD